MSQAILVTGAAGFIGAALVQGLIARGEEVIGIDNLNSYYDPNLKRARLSQICNRLHKAGILHARMVGRSRMFGLTRSALAQLIAWGIVGGDE